SLTATIPEAFMRTAGQVQIAVTNSPPGGGSVAAGLFSIISAPPVLTAVIPSSVTVQSADLTVQLAGTGFTRTATASINGGSISTSYNSSTSLTAIIPGSLLGQVGILNIVVTNPRTSSDPALTSAPAAIQVINPAPVIISLDPSTIQAGQIAPV